MKNSSYYIAPVGDRTHDLPHTVASNMVKVSHALNHSATEATSNSATSQVGDIQLGDNSGQLGDNSSQIGDNPISQIGDPTCRRLDLFESFHLEYASCIGHHIKST